jgi:hypothetical protein
MERTILDRTVPRLVGVAVLLVALGSAAGCGGDDKTACKEIKQEIQNVTSSGMQQTGNLPGLAKTYRDGATKIRDSGKKGSGDVEDAADDVAKEMEKLASAVENVSGSGSPTIPSSSGLSNAGAELQKACNS